MNVLMFNAKQSCKRASRRSPPRAQTVGWKNSSLPLGASGVDGSVGRAPTRHPCRVTSAYVQK